MKQIDDRALQFAIAAHGDQKYGDGPYSDHLLTVRSIALEYADSSSSYRVGLVAILHDILEDTGVSFYEIEDKFGRGVAHSVWCLTDAEGKNRAERKRKTWHKIRSCEIAVLVKLADRIANTESSKNDGGRLFEMYKKEFPIFEAALYVPGQYEPMWERLRNATYG